MSENSFRRSLSGGSCPTTTPSLKMTDSAVSHQLRVLRGAKLVKGVKEGKEVRYSLDDDHVTKIMEYGLTHVNEGK